MLRVVHISETAKRGGAEVVVRTLCAGLERYGIASTLVSIYPDRLSTEERAAYGAPVVTIGRRSRRDLSFWPRLLATLRGLSPDIVHAHLPAGRYAGRLAAATIGVRGVVFTEHGEPPAGALARVADRLLHPRTQRFITFTDAQAERFARREGVARARIAVVPNGIVSAAPKRSREQVRSELGVDRDAALFLIPARLSPEKNHRLALRACAGLAGAGVPNWHLLVAGGGPEEAALRHEAEELGIASRVHFLGVRSDLPDLYNAVDVCIVCSLREMMPLALGEAMTCGVPVVSTPWAGVEDFVDDGETGTVARGWEPDSLRAALLLALGAHGSPGFVAAARKKAAQRFDCERMLEAHATLYRSLAKRSA